MGLVSGGVSKCGDKTIPSYYTRLDHPEIAEFIASPDTYNSQNISKLGVESRQSQDENLHIQVGLRQFQEEDLHTQGDSGQI